MKNKLINWEIVYFKEDSYYKEKMVRSRVPDGWIVCHTFSTHDSKNPFSLNTFFVPDKNNKWIYGDTVQDFLFTKIRDIRYKNDRLGEVNIPQIGMESLEHCGFIYIGDILCEKKLTKKKFLDNIKCPGFGKYSLDALRCALKSIGQEKHIKVDIDEYIHKRMMREKPNG